MVSVTVEIRKSAPAPSAREPSAGSGSGKPASARPRFYPCHASCQLHVITCSKLVACRRTPETQRLDALMRACGGV